MFVLLLMSLDLSLSEVLTSDQVTDRQRQGGRYKNKEVEGKEQREQKTLAQFVPLSEPAAAPKALSRASSRVELRQLLVGTSTCTDLVES